jgi:hypothetical protein
VDARDWMLVRSSWSGWGLMACENGFTLVTPGAN